MKFGWPTAQIGSVAQPIERPETPLVGKSYRQVGVRLWGEGAYERETIDGGGTQYTIFNRLAADDIIVNKIWARNGSVSVVQPELDGAYCSTEFPLFRPDLEQLEPRWFYWMTKTKWFWEQCDAKSRGTSGKNRIRPDQFLQIEIPLPPLAEQGRIVAKIERVAGKVAEAQGLRDQSIKEGAEIMFASTSSVFSQLSNVSLVPIKELGSDGENSIQIGPFGAQVHNSDYVEQGVPVLNVGNVWPEGLRLDHVNYVSEDKASQLSRYTVEPDDLLFARSGATLGKVCLVPEYCRDWLMTAHLFRVRFDRQRCLPQFAFAALRGAKAVRDQVFDQVRGATRPGFNTTLLGNVRLPLPSIAEQRRVVSYLENVQAKADHLKVLQAQTAAELDALLPAVLDRAFRGEL